VQKAHQAGRKQAGQLSWGSALLQRQPPLAAGHHGLLHELCESEVRSKSAEINTPV